MAVATPLKWAGSKARLMPQLLQHLPKGQRLIEPFAGSCAVMMATDYPKYLIADINPDLINLYKVIAADCEKFISHASAIFNIANREVAYYNIRHAFNYSALADITKAVYFLYLNRHGYRGLCRYNKKGHFNVPFGGYKKPYFPLAEILTFAEKARRATFICASYEETLGMVQPGDVVYCDPPYIPVSTTSNFAQYHTDGFGHSDQVNLCDLLLDLVIKKIPVAASNSASELARHLYGENFDLVVFDAPRSIGAAKGSASSAKEILAVSA